jgi:hypothetical protein
MLKKSFLTVFCFSLLLNNVVFATENTTDKKNQKKLLNFLKDISPEEFKGLMQMSNNLSEKEKCFLEKAFIDFEEESNITKKGKLLHVVIGAASGIALWIIAKAIYDRYLKKDSIINIVDDTLKRILMLFKSDQMLIKITVDEIKKKIMGMALNFEELKPYLAKLEEKLKKSFENDEFKATMDNMFKKA